MQSSPSIGRWPFISRLVGVMFRPIRLPPAWVGRGSRLDTLRAALAALSVVTSPVRSRDGSGSRSAGSTKCLLASDFRTVRPVRRCVDPARTSDLESALSRLVGRAVVPPCDPLPKLDGMCGAGVQTAEGQPRHCSGICLGHSVSTSAGSTMVGLSPIRASRQDRGRPGTPR